VTPYYLEGKKKAVWHVIEQAGVASYGAPDREHAEWRLQTPAITDWGDYIPSPSQQRLAVWRSVRRLHPAGT